MIIIIYFTFVKIKLKLLKKFKKNKTFLHERHHLCWNVSVQPIGARRQCNIVVWWRQVGVNLGSAT